MFFRYINESRFGFKSTKKGQVKVPTQLGILENLRCHKLDEYPVISCEDEALVPPLACSFSKGGRSCHVLALVDENGSVVLYNTNLNGDNAIITDWSAHNNAVFDVEWMCNDNKLLTASGDQTIALWDVTSKQKLLTFKGHTSSVRSVKYRPQDDAVFASGSRDGHVRIWDSRCNVKGEKVSCVSLIKNAHSVNVQSNKKKKSRPGGPSQSQDCQQSVTCVLFQNDNLLTTSGAVDGCVKVWDMRKLKQDNNSPVYSFPYVGTSKRTHGFSSLVFDSYYSKLYANCTDDVIYCYDFISYSSQPVCTYKGHRNTSFYVKSALSPDNEYLLSGSSDEFAYIWQVSKPNASPVLLKGHRSEISDVAWCKTDLFRVVTTSDDNTLRVWRYDPTVELRHRLNRSDTSCNIVGSAERTHRDIGTCVEQGTSSFTSPTRPPMKRSATVATFGPVVVQSPKQAKTATKSSASPSIKMWLKRSASDTESLKTQSVQSSSASVHTGLSKTTVNSETENASDVSKKDVKTKSDAEKTNVTVTLPDKKETLCDNIETSPSKRPKIEISNTTNGIKKSCKRKLVDDESPKKSKRFREDNENASRENNSPIKDNEDKRLSPLKDLSSIMNKSPVKCDKTNDTFSSPARGLLEKCLNSVCQSPTANLPNLVVDGPQRKILCSRNESKTVDWLTQMRKEKLDSLSPASKKSLKLEKSISSPKSSKSVEDSPVPCFKSKSPLRGVRSITSFFSHQFSPK